MRAQLWRLIVGAVVLVAAILALTSRPNGQRAADRDWGAARARMVDTQIKARGIDNAAVLQAMSRVPRHLFVPSGVRPVAYEDRPLPIGYDQTISQPYVVAYMTQALQPSRQHKVLEIGTGSGYQAAVLAELVRHVYTIEIVSELAERARRTLADTGYRNVTVRAGNGYLGWPEEAPFDRIIVTAGAPDAPITLLRQLADGGRMVVPVGDPERQELILFRSEHGMMKRSRLCSCVFVKLVGREGW
jgi:protein-L-isoaspartate(D-aspartate) O-methyltransferase